MALHRLTIWPLLIVAGGGAVRGAPPIDFQRQVLPILSEHCLACHGVDAQQRQGQLRLDDRAAALAGGESGLPAIVPGRGDQGELLRRIASTDSAEQMPPPDHNRPLSADQIATLRLWIEQAASYETHWAFTAPVKPPIPANALPHPVDALVQTHLAQQQLMSAPPAQPEILCRRLYLDLLGLPPSPAEIEQFRAEGYEATVERLLSSERYGEKWARHWLDLARYSDTNGYEKDLPREQWAWRDWVIDALNQDLPYDRFLIEQIAGDLLPQATQSQWIATGFLRNSMINEEGAIVPEQFRMVEMFDRMDCLGKAVLGLSLQCGQCHSHKFDPLLQREYYGMFAFLNNTYEAQSWVYSDEQLAEIAEIRRQVALVDQRWKAARPDWPAELAQWEQAWRAGAPSWELCLFQELGAISGLNHPTQEADRSILMKGHTSSDVFFIAHECLDGATGLRLEALVHRDLPHGGPGRTRLGTFNVQELEVFLRPPGANDWQQQKLVNATADFAAPEVKNGDGKQVRGPVPLLIDGSDSTAWDADRGPALRNQPAVAVVQFAEPLSAPAGTQLKIALRMSEMLGCCRLSLTRSPAPSAPPVPHQVTLACEVPPDQRSTQQQDQIFAAWRDSHPEAQAYSAEIVQLRKSWPTADTSVLHLAERNPRDPRITHLLDRGQWDQPLEAVEPHVPAAFHPWPEGAPKNRLGFAQWLADRRSPLVARVAVNRVWQALFGQGLVETAEDFGTRSPQPEYRDLLDYLALDFMEHGWSQKHLLRLIVTSAIYRQSSHATPAQIARDPRNTLLARGPRFRAEAEVVRDLVLSAAGLLHHQRGGPGVIPPVPQNVLDYNYTYPDYWKPAEGPQRYRRSVYLFRKRSMPDPTLSNFDSPNGDSACARRVRSNTPLAALTALNEPVFVEAARALALRVLREAGASDDQRAAYAFRLCTQRSPSPAECQAICGLAASRRQRLAEGWLNPREIATGKAAELPQLPPGTTPQDAAAWTLVARVLLNLDETLTKN